MHISCILVCIIFYLSLVSSKVTITVDWTKITYVSKTSVTLQVVVNPMIQRGSPIHDGTFKALADLQADYVRFVPWLPYPQLSVAELQPPTGNPVCASIAYNQTLYLQCYYGVFESFEFVSFGNPEGRCGGFAVGTCSFDMSKDIVEKLCLGRSYCQVNVTKEWFGDPSCNGLPLRLAVQGSCSADIDQTFWDFSLIDPIMEDFMNATSNHSVIINFSTTPEWMWNTPEPIVYPANQSEVIWNYEQGWDVRDNSLQDIAMYYQRLVSWYTKGGFYDEYSNYHQSGHYYNIPIWEVLNEVDYEHTMTPAMYTRIYDAIVGGISEVQPNMKFVGLALANLYVPAVKEANWFQYFLNSSNHLPGIPIDYISYHFYASANATNISSFEDIFPQCDYFFQEVEEIEIVRKLLNPTVKTTIDEIGVILWDDSLPEERPIEDLYWSAAGGMFAYVFVNLVQKGIDVLGESQLVGYPSQFPEVSMMDFTNGKPNARYWVLYMLHENFEAGDQLVETSSTNNEEICTQAFLTRTGRKILIINKISWEVTVTLPSFSAGTLQYVDETTDDLPPGRVALFNSTFTLNPFATAVVSLYNK